MATWSVSDLQLAIWWGMHEKSHKSHGRCPTTIREQELIDRGDAAEKELQRREAVEGVYYERLT